MFDTNSVLDIDALEDFVKANQDELVNQEQGIQIDITKMMTNKKVSQIKLKYLSS